MLWRILHTMVGKHDYLWHVKKWLVFVQASQYYIMTIFQNDWNNDENERKCIYYYRSCYFVLSVLFVRLRSYVRYEHVRGAADALKICVIRSIWHDRILSSQYKLGYYDTSRRRYKTKLEGWRIILKGHFELTYSYLYAWKRRKLRLRSEGKYKDTTIGILQWIPKIHEFGTRARFKASRSWSWKRIVIWQTDVKRSDSKKNGGKKYTLWRIIIPGEPERCRRQYRPYWSHEGRRHSPECHKDRLTDDNIVKRQRYKMMNSLTSIEI